MADKNKGAAEPKKANPEEGVVKAQEPVEGGTGGAMGAAVALTKAGVEVPDGADENTIWGLVTQFILSQTGGGGEEAPAEGAPEAEAASEVLSALGATTSKEAIMALKTKYVSREEYTAQGKRLEAIESERLSERVESSIAANVKANKINPNDADQVKACREMANENIDRFDTFMASQPSIITPGRVVNPSDKVNGTDSREKVIMASVREYDEAPKAYQKTTTQKAWVNLSLSEKKLAKLTDEDTGKFGIAAG